MLLEERRKKKEETLRKAVSLKPQPHKDSETCGCPETMSNDPAIAISLYFLYFPFLSLPLYFFLSLPFLSFIFPSFPENAGSIERL